MLVDITNVGVIWARRLRPIEESPAHRPLSPPVVNPTKR